MCEPSGGGAKECRILGDWVSGVLPKVAKQNVYPHNCSNNATRYAGTSSAVRPETSGCLSRGIHSHTP
jgi:hypothetical protein